MSSRSGGSARGGIDKTVGSTIDGSAAPAPTPPGSGKGSATKSSALMLPGTEEMEVQDWLELWGIGYGQWKVSHCANGIWAADGAELLLLGSLVRAVTEEWNFSAFERGAIVGVVFIGVFFGNLLSGTLGDAIGRRSVTLLSYILVVIFSILSVASWDFTSLSVVRFGVGVAFGVGQPAGLALANETSPAHFRLIASSLAGTLYFVLGEMFAVLLICYDDVDMKDLDWRWLIVMGSIPSMMFGIYGMFVLHESPAWLYSQEKIQEAIEVLEWVRGENFRSRATKCGCFFGRGEGVALIEEKFGFYPDDFAPQDVKTPEELDPRSVWRQPIRLRPPSPSRKVAMDVVGQVTSVRGRTASKDQQPDTGVIGTGPNAATSIDGADDPSSRSLVVKKQDAATSLTPRPFSAREASSETWTNRVGQVFGPPFLLTTFFLCWSCFTCNNVFYGGMYAFPQVLADMGDTLTIRPAYSLLLACAWEIVGGLIAFYVGQSFYRKPAIAIWLVGGTLSVSLFLLALPNSKPKPEQITVVSEQASSSLLRSGDAPIASFAASTASPDEEEDMDFDDASRSSYQQGRNSTASSTSSSRETSRRGEKHSFRNGPRSPVNAEDVDAQEHELTAAYLSNFVIFSTKLGPALKVVTPVKTTSHARTSSTLKIKVESPAGGSSFEAEDRRGNNRTDVEADESVEEQANSDSDIADSSIPSSGAGEKTEKRSTMLLRDSEGTVVDEGEPHDEKRHDHDHSAVITVRRRKTKQQTHLQGEDDNTEGNLLDEVDADHDEVEEDSVDSQEQSRIHRHNVRKNEVDQQEEEQDDEPSFLEQGSHVRRAEPRPRSSLSARASSYVTTLPTAQPISFVEVGAASAVTSGSSSRYSNGGSSGSSARDDTTRRKRKRKEMEQSLLQSGSTSFRDHLLEICMELGLFGQKFMVTLGFVMVYLFVIESYPTHIRATGTAVCLSCGRIGSITAPTIYEKMTEASGGPVLFFIYLVFLLAMNMMFLLFMPLIETGGLQLSDDAYSTDKASRLWDELTGGSASGPAEKAESLPEDSTGGVDGSGASGRSARSLDHHYNLRPGDTSGGREEANFANALDDAQKIEK